LHLDYIETPQKIIREHSTYIWLSRKGLKEQALPYAHYQPKPSTVRHLYAVNKIRLHLQRSQFSARWVARRTIRAYSDRSPLPDAELHTRDFPLIALQVLEPSLLTPVTLQEEMTRLTALSGHYTRFWYFLHERSVPSVQAALQTHDTSALGNDQKLADRLILFHLDGKELSHLSEI